MIYTNREKRKLMDRYRLKNLELINYNNILSYE